MSDSGHGHLSEDILTRPAPPADRRIAYDPGPGQFGDLRLPRGAGEYPIALLLHGGYWRARYDLAYMGHIAAALTVRGWATWNVEYRRIGDAGGGWPGTFSDVAAAADALRALAAPYALDLTRAVAVGHSSGGHLALWLAGRARIPASSPLACGSPLPLAGVVALAGVPDLRRAWALHLSNDATHLLLGGAPDVVGDRYAATSPYDLLPLGTRQVLVHGTSDAHVPFELSARYVDAAHAAGDDVRLHALDGADHFALIDPRSPVWPLVAAEVLRLGGRV